MLFRSEEEGQAATLTYRFSPPLLASYLSQHLSIERREQWRLIMEQPEKTAEEERLVLRCPSCHGRILPVPALLEKELQNMPDEVHLPFICKKCKIRYQGEYRLITIFAGSADETTEKLFLRCGVCHQLYLTGEPHECS